MAEAAALTDVQIAQISRVREIINNGTVSVDALRDDAHAALAAHGIDIPAARRDELNAGVVAALDRHEVVDFTRVPGIGGATTTLGSDTIGMGCVLCDLGLTIAFTLLLIFTVAAVAAAIIAFAPEVALPVAMAFLESSFAVNIAFGVIELGAAALAAIVCADLIKCT